MSPVPPDAAKMVLQWLDRGRVEPPARLLTALRRGDCYHGSGRPACGSAEPQRGWEVLWGSRSQSPYERDVNIFVRWNPGLCQDENEENNEYPAFQEHPGRPPDTGPPD